MPGKGISINTIIFRINVDHITGNANISSILSEYWRRFCLIENILDFRGNHCSFDIGKLLADLLLNSSLKSGPRFATTSSVSLFFSGQDTISHFSEQSIAEIFKVGIKIGFVMDPLPAIKIKKDSTFAMMLAAQKSGWEIHVMYQHDLYTENDTARAHSRIIRVDDNPEHWYDISSEQDIRLAELDAILMRKDPPFDIEYIASTYILELAEKDGSLIVNRPSSLRDHNEKMFIASFPQCCTPFMVSRNIHKLREFVTRQFEDREQDVILKPLDGMGGASIYRVNPRDPNLSVILETVSENEHRTVMAQRYIPEIAAGDKRVLLIDGEAIPYALARIPAQGETRGNLAAGGSGVGVELSERDRWICQQVGPTLKRQGLLFAGIDIIGDYLTEINITSPTCIRELDQIYQLDIAGDLMRNIESNLRS